MTRNGLILGLLGLAMLTGCSKLSAKGKRDCGADTWKNEEPPFCLTVPAGYVAKGAPTKSGTGMTMEFRNDAVSNFITVNWFPGSLAETEEIFNSQNRDGQTQREDLGDGLVFMKSKSKLGATSVKAFAKSSKPPVNPDDPSWVQVVTCEGGWGSDPKYANPEVEQACRSLMVK